jgi:ParB family chromosome partitioning protein
MSLFSFGARLLGSITTDLEESKRLEATGVQPSLRMGVVPLDLIEADPDQPRKHFDLEELRALAETIRTEGLLQPIRVRWSDTLHCWVVVSGERRFRAAQLLGLKSIPCTFARDGLSPEDILAQQLVENLHRADLNAIEKARAFKALMERKNLDGSGLALELKLDPSTVTHALKLLGLSEDVQAAVAKGELAARTAYELTKLPSPEAQQAMAKRVLEGRLSTAEVASVVRKKRRRKRQLTCVNPSPHQPVPAVIDTCQLAPYRYSSARGDSVVVTPVQPATCADILQILLETTGIVQAQVDGERQAPAA